jgi:prepilin-type N-terminal cleavage/methylation domain-containing protein
MMSRSTRPLRRAFSLIEVMVAVTLLSVMTVGLMAMFYHTQRAFRLGANQKDVHEGGRAAMELIARELQEMYPSYLSNVVNFQAVTGSTVRTAMPLPFGPDRINILQDLTFLARQGDEWIGMTYRVDDLDADGNETGIGTLYRASVPVAYTNFFRLTQRTNVSDLMGLIATNEGGINLTNYRSLQFDRVIDGVVHFQVFASDQFGRFYTSNQPPRRIVDPEGDYPEKYYFYDWVPAYLDIELGILDPKAVEQHRARTGIPANAMNFLEDQGHRVQLFKRRVPIRNRHAEFDVLSSR